MSSDTNFFCCIPYFPFIQLTPLVFGRLSLSNCQPLIDNIIVARGYPLQAYVSSYHQCYIASECFGPANSYYL